MKNNNVIVGITSYNRQLALYTFGNLFSSKKEVTKKDKEYGEDVNNKIGAFAIYLPKKYSDNINVAERLLEWAREEGLTIAGYQKSFRTSRDISNAQLGDFITVALSDKYDVDYKRNTTGEKKLNGVKTYHLIDDYYEIVSALTNVIEEKRRKKNQARPKQRTYREMALADLDTYVQKKTVVEKKKQSKTKAVEVNVFPHYYTVGNRTYRKNPNDVIVYGSIL